MAFAVTLVLGWAGHSSAQASDEAAEHSDSEEDRTERAGQMFQEGMRAYEAGEFEDSAHLMSRAYSLHPEPILLYNLGRSLQAAGDNAGAVDAYERYLASEGDLDRRTRAEAHLRVAREQVEHERALAAAAAQPEPEPPAPAPAGPGVDPVPWIIVGVGVALAGAGAVFGVMSLDRQQAATDEPSFEPAHAAAVEADTFAIIANVGIIAGAVAAGAGLLWGILSLTSGDSGGSVDVAIGPGSVQVRGSF